MRECYRVGAERFGWSRRNPQPRSMRDGNELVGWGSEPYFSEYDATGRMLLDGVLPRPDLSYRARLEPWVGLPLKPPAAVARRTGAKTTVYASWNGATELAAWRVRAGTGRRAPVVATTANGGFETAIAVPKGYKALQVQALDARGRVIGTAAPVTG